MTKTVFFISDLHLGLESPEKELEKELLFVKFLKFSEKKISDLYILGDLFDYWFEYKRVFQKGYFRTFNAMAELVNAGTNIHYIIGNHDFLHVDFFEKHIGTKLYHDPIEVDINNKKFFLGHGDGLVKNDTGYKILKKVLRNPITQRLYSMIHPDLGIKIASTSSKKSRDYTKQKDYGENDWLFETAKEKIDNGFDYVLFGHSHNLAEKKYKDGYYINLGTWLSKPCYGKFEDQKFDIIEWK